MTPASTNALVGDLRTRITDLTEGRVPPEALADAARTLAGLAADVLTRLLPDPTGPDGDLSGPYGPDGWMTRYALRESDDTVNTDHELIHSPCGQRLCDAEHGDTLAVLVGLAREHECGLDLSGRPYLHDHDVLDEDVTLADVLDHDQGDRPEPGFAVLTETGTLLSHMAASSAARHGHARSLSAHDVLGLAWKAGWRWRGLAEHLADDTPDTALAARRNHAIRLLPTTPTTDPATGPSAATQRHTALRQAFAAGWHDRSQAEGLGTGGYPDTD